MKKFVINGQHISLSQIDEVIKADLQIEIGPEARKNIIKCRDYLEKKIASSESLHYGINTGFGSLCNEVISNEDLSKLQRNLVLSHACGMGDFIPEKIVRLMILLKVISLSHGHSGIQEKTINRLVFLYNEKITPLVFEQGSLGASGDLAPLAHLSLPLIGEGDVIYKGKRVTCKEVFKEFNIQPLVLGAKEGLALLNGTQFMCAFAIDCINRSLELWNKWSKISALSLDAYNCRPESFYPHPNEIRKQNGQIETAKNISKILKSSQIFHQKKEHVQDPYSFRCIPQVHGASKDTLDYCAGVIEKEINAVTDNPTIFPDLDEIISGGNFHGQPLALILDYMSISMAEMGSISERRIFKLISGTRELPPFLVSNPGLNSGFMISQYTCASIVSQNKQLCSPASIDSIDSSNGQEDHVSMGANAATKLFRVIDNCFTIAGIELFISSQAIEYRRPQKSSAVIEEILIDLRKVVPIVKEDLLMASLQRKAKKFVEENL